MSGDIRRNTPNHDVKITQFPLESSPPKLLIFTKILHNVVALVALFNLAHRRRYPIPFLNDRAISGGGNFALFLPLNWLPW